MNKNIEYKLIKLNKTFKLLGFDFSIIFNACEE